MILDKISDILIEESSHNIYYLKNQTNNINIKLSQWTDNKFLIINLNWGITINFDHQTNAKTDIQIINIYQTSQTKSVCNAILHENSKTNIYILSLLTKWSDVVVDGNIYIAPGANWSSGHLLEENLILDPNIKIYAKPVLDVQNSQVSASHAARISKIDNKSLFYMMSRWLSKQIATDIILDGYINNILDKFEFSEKTKKTIKEMILK